MSMMDNKGVTLIELIIAVTIIGILAAAVAFSFQGWSSGYNVERQIKAMHIDLMDARARAMQRNRMHFVALAATQYSIYDDSDPAPDGDGVPDTANDDPVSQESLDARYPVTWSDLATTTVTFDTRGISDGDKTICSNSDATADYNCIEISATRINMGQLATLIPAGGACDAANCVEK